MTTPTGVPPGWYHHDPDQSEVLRWYDGEQWSDRTRPTIKYRLLNSWLYALATALGAIAYIGEALIEASYSGWDWLGVVLILFVLHPLILLLVGLVLGLRRGYDWLTLAVCAIVYLLTVMTAVMLIPFNRSLSDWSMLNLLSGLGMLFITMFIPFTQIGMLSGTLIRYLRLRYKAKHGMKPTPTHFPDE